MSDSVREARILASSASRRESSGSSALVGSGLLELESGYSGSKSGSGLARACQAFFSSFSLLVVC